MQAEISRRTFLRTSTATAMAVSSSLGRTQEVSNSADLPITGEPDSRLQPLDQMMTELLTKFRLPGASLAVGRNRKVFYARGFGWADVAARKPVQPTSLFRMASISKPITAVTVMHAVQQRKLKLDDRVWPVLSKSIDERPADKRWHDITIRQLLQHSGGWDRDKSFDPMFRAEPFARMLNVEPPAKPEHVIRMMLRQPLDFTPGERYAYSNFGYCLLGRVLEAVDQTSYFDSVRRRVLEPLGLKRLRLGHTLKALAHSDEVSYYGETTSEGRELTGPCVFPPRLGEQVPWPYGAWHLEAMDAHGGWIGSAADLVRLAMALDQRSSQQLWQPQTLNEMWSRPPAPTQSKPIANDEKVHYGCGWFVRDVGPNKINVWHTGSLNGTSTILVRRHDGFCWAALFNTRNGVNPETGKHDVVPNKEVDPLVHQAVDAVRQWPAGDLSI